MHGTSRSRGWDKEIPHGVLPVEQLVLSNKWARNLYPTWTLMVDCYNLFYRTDLRRRREDTPMR